jgi:uncharacterized repeat protein (TIGR01451 family)
VRDFTSDPPNNSTFGTLDVRLTFTNNTGANLTRLRFRVVDLTTFPAPSGVADLRPRTSTAVVVTVDRPPCGSGTSNVTVQGTTLEQPPSQLNGGGFNSSLSVGSITLGTPLANGASVDVRFLLGIQQTGNAKLGLIPEGLGPTGPVSGNVIYLTGNTDAFATIPVTIEKATGQADPASSEPINFTATFNEPVTGFDPSDVTLGGTAVASTVVVTGGPSVYNVAVSGVTSNGTLTASIPAGVASGPLGSLNLASTSVDNSVDVALVAPPSLTKVFNPSTIALDMASALTFTITNAQSTALTGVAFTDTLPTGLTVANDTATVCGGTLTTTAPTGIALSGATVGGNGQCQFSVSVVGTAAGQYVNTTGNVTSANGGTGNTATAGLVVAAQATIAKAFGASEIPLMGTTPLTFTVTNPNAATALTGVAFTDTLPAGLVVATPNGVTGSCGAGTITATQSTNVISLSGASIATSASCTFSVNVTGIAPGLQNNTTGNVSSNESGFGGTASASVIVVAPPSISSAFSPTSVAQGTSTSLLFTLTNPAGNAAALTGVGFTDTLPAGLVVATPNNVTGSCGGGAITAASGTNTVMLSGATLPLNGACTFSVDVNAASTGTLTNTTGNVTSANGGTGATASAQLTVTIVAPARPIPTLSQWALLAMSMLMLLVAVIALRRGRRDIA